MCECMAWRDLGRHGETEGTRGEEATAQECLEPGSGRGRIPVLALEGEPSFVALAEGINAAPSTLTTGEAL